MANKKDEVKIENNNVIDKEEIIKEVKAKAFVDLKDEINDYIEKEASKVVNSINRKILKEKNRKIFWKNVIIILLILVHFSFLYCLYNNIEIPVINDLIEKNRTYKCEDKENIPKDNNNNNENKEIVNNNDSHDLNYYTLKYGFLLERIKLNTKDYEQFFGDFDSESLPNNIKLNLAFGLLTQDKKSINDNLIMVQEEALKESFTFLFGTDLSFQNENFMVGNTEMVYSENINTYIGIIEANENKEFVYKITSIDEEDNHVSLTFKVGIIYDNNLYDIKNNLIRSGSKEILDSDNLDSYICSFTKNGENYIFESIKKNK